MKHNLTNYRLQKKKINIYLLSYGTSILLIKFFNKICIIFINFLKNKDIIVQLKYPQTSMNYDIE